MNHELTSDDRGQRSVTGVWIANDFRDNLIVDRYDPIFTRMRASKLKHMRSENSEDVVTWNVFRSLSKIAPALWLPLIWRKAFGEEVPPPDPSPWITIRLWLPVPPPPLLLRSGDEGDSEIDVAIEGDGWVWFIEAKLGSSISSGTSTRPGRNQILRNLDVGSYYSGARDFHFSLLYSDHRTPAGALEAIKMYSDLSVVRGLLQDHRPDSLPNLRSIGSLRWSDIAGAISHVASSGAREEERFHAVRAHDWMRARDLISAHSQEA